MRGTVRLAAAGALLGLLGCGDEATTPPDLPLEIHVLFGSPDETLDLSLDGAPIYSGTVGLVPLAGPAASIYPRVEPGAHRLEARLGERTTASDFVLDAPTYVLIQRDEHAELRVTLTHEQPLWD